MKTSEFKSFRNVVIEAGNDHLIWGAGYLFMNLTDKQHSIIWEICNKKGFRHESVTNPVGTFDGVVLPSGLVLLKETTL